MSGCPNSCLTNARSDTQPEDLFSTTPGSEDLLEGMSAQMEELRLRLEQAIGRISTLEDAFGLGRLQELSCATGNEGAKSDGRSAVKVAHSQSFTKLQDRIEAHELDHVEHKQGFAKLWEENARLVKFASLDLSLIAKAINIDYESLKFIENNEELKVSLRKTTTVHAAKDDMIQESLEAACSYALQETVWDAALLICMPLGIGPVDIGLLVLALALQAALQVMLCVLVVHLARDNYSVIYGLRAGCENAVGYDAHEVDQFLYANFGPILSCVSIALWAMNVAADLRHISDFLLAVWSLQKGPETTYSVHPSTRRISLLTMSYGRVIFMTFSSLVQAAIATCLLIAGSVWLSATVVTMDLLLNGVALNFILEIDELVYHLLCSAKVKTVTTHLQPLRLPPRLVQPGKIPIRSLVVSVAWIVFCAVMIDRFAIPNFVEVEAVKSICHKHEH